MPVKIIYGKNEFKNINKYIKNRKTLLITSSGFIKRGLLEEINSLTKNLVGIVSNIKTNPEFKDLKIIYDEVKKIDFELIVAIGGGSVLDSAKFISVYNDSKDYQFVADITKAKIAKKSYKLIPKILIPTTAGTGSEITSTATIWDMQEQKKYSLDLPDLYCELAIYDPVLTLSLPKNITIQTGLDTLSHALESIWNKNCSPITIEFAIRSARLIMANLAKLANDLKNIEYRSNIMMACMYAGFAFSNTKTAIAHSMSYHITINKALSHGIACSFTLPMLIDSIIGKYDFIDNALKEIFGDLSSNKLRALFKELGVSTQFIDYGVSEQELSEILALLSNNERMQNSLIKTSYFN